MQKKNVSSTNITNSDVDIQYPLAEYNNSSTMSKEIIGGTSPDLWTGGGDETKSVDINPNRSTTSGSTGYMENRVFGSKSHAIHFNDNENSLTIVHSEGGGIKYFADGSMQITTPKTMEQMAGTGYDLHVDASGSMVFKGDLKLKVDGTFDVECLNYNLTVNGNKKEVTTGTETTVVGENKLEQITGSSSLMVGQKANNIYLGGLQNNVKGAFDNNVNGPASYVSSGNAIVSSENIMNVSSDNMNLSANNMTVQGGVGTIGGINMLFSGKGAVFEEGVQAPTFHGDVTGRADTAIASDTAVYASYGGGPGSAAGWSNVNTPVPTITKPTATLVLTYLQKSAGGIRKVAIDIGDHLKNFLNKTKSTDGISTTPIDTPSKVRSKLRNDANQKASNFISTVQGSGKLNPSWFEKVPPHIGRVLSKTDPIIDPEQTQGDVQAYTPVPPKTTVNTIVVDSKYNPLLVESSLINGTTVLGPGISISKFLASDDPIVMGWVKDAEEKASIAKYYYLHALLMQSVRENNGQFKNHRLVVAEGLYRPGPNENIVPNSIADLKKQGRAVVYKLLDKNGKQDLDATFELAAWWMSTQSFEKMILDYDTIDNGNISAQIIIIFPKLTLQEGYGQDATAEWRAVFAGVVETHYNGQKLSKGELVEVPEVEFDPETGYEGGRVWKDADHRYNLDQNLNPPDIGYDNSTRGKLDPASLVKVQDKSAGGFGQGPVLLEPASAKRWRKLKSAGEAAGFTMELNAGYRSWYYQYLAYKSMKSADPGAAVAKAGRSRHGTGKAIDLANCSSGSALWEWMKKEGWKPENGGWKQAESDFFKYKDPVHFSDNGH